MSDERTIQINGTLTEMFMVVEKSEAKDGYTLVKEAEIPAPPTWLTRELKARGIHAYDVMTYYRDGIRYYSPRVPRWIACVYQVAKCRRHDARVEPGAFFMLVERIAHNCDLQEAIVAADDAKFVWELLKQQGLL